jgi:hypothetical protein
VTLKKSVDSLVIVYPVWVARAVVSVLVSMPNVIGPAAAPLSARLSVHVITTTAPGAKSAPIVTVSAAPTVAVAEPPVTATAFPPLVAVHAVSALAEKIFALGVMSTVPELATLVAGVKVTTKFPPAWPATTDDVLDALVQATEAGKEWQG